MKISYEWLREYVNTKIRAENLSQILTMAGHEVGSVEKKGNDFIFDMEITANRADCLSHIGMAREAAAVTKKRLMLPYAEIRSEKSANPIKVFIEDKIDCPRYSARVIRGVKVGPSPKWLVKRIESMGLRPVNNIVDITNFVLFETGQPLHAFDLDKLEGNEIIVRRARTNEKITVIDGSDRTLQPRMVVIADKKKAIAIAGVMGGKDTEVTEKTKNILLESAYFNNVSIRRTSLVLGISTDSSYRFERGVDLESVVKASDRAASLIKTTAKGRVFELVDAGVRQKPLNKVTLKPVNVNKILGTTLSPGQIMDCLKRLGFKASGSSSLEVRIPSFRADITREADLIEEVARIYGYDNIPLIAPSIVATEQDPASEERKQKIKTAKETMAALGYGEAITYSLVSRQMMKDMAFSDEGIIDIRNPLSKEQEIMRQSLIPGLLRAVYNNISRQLSRIKLFELSNIYFLKEGAYNEDMFLSACFYDKSQRSKHKDYRDEGIFKLKGAVTALCERLGIPGLAFEKTTHTIFVPDETVTVMSGDAVLGAMGRIKPEILKDFDIKGDLYAAEFNFSSMMSSANLKRYYRELPRFPFSYRDISFAIDSSITYKEIEALIRQTGGAIVESVECLSEYTGEQILASQRGLVIRVIYRSKMTTLTEEEISSVDAAIRDNLTKKLEATLR